MSLENPDKRERAWMRAVVDLGCIVCILEGLGHTPAVVHHILGKGGRRLGHLESIPLCHGHHASGECTDRCVSRHPWKNRFYKRYGTEIFLLSKTRGLIGWTA